MKLGIAIFPADFAIRPDELARAVEERGFESLLFTDHTHIPRDLADAQADGGGARRRAAALHPQLRPLRRHDVRRRRDADAASGNRRVPGARTRADRDGKGDRQPRCPLGRSRAVRCRRRLDPPGDRQPRHRPTDALGSHGRAGAGDAGDLDPGRGAAPRPPRGLRPDLVVAQAEATTTPTDPRRRRRQRRHPPRPRIRRRMDATRRYACGATRRANQELQQAAHAAGRVADIPVTVQGADPDARALEELREVGVTRATLYAPSADTQQVLRFLDDVAPLVDATNPT